MDSEGTRPVLTLRSPNASPAFWAKMTRPCSALLAHPTKPSAFYAHPPPRGNDDPDASRAAAWGEFVDVKMV